MSLISKAAGYIRHPRNLVQLLIGKGYFNWMPDKAYVKLNYWSVIGKRLNLKNPVTYCEKLQWIKLYDHNPDYNRMVDKYTAKEFAAERIGWDHIIPTLGVWDRIEDVDFDALPERFVIKTTHDSGGVVICKDKSKLDIAAAKTKLSKSLTRNFYRYTREWPYKDVKPRIIAEEYIEDKRSGELHDYKFYCFNGECKIMLVISDRENPDGFKVDFFDMDQNFLEVKFEHQDRSVVPPKLPDTFNEMRRLAEILSKDIPHVRVDFYEIEGRILFGEMTFFSSSGTNPFCPEEWNIRAGSWITLPERKNG